MTTKKRVSFREKMAMSREKDKSRASSYGYLNIPSGVNILKIESTEKVFLDFLPYVVSDEVHPDRIEDQLAFPGDLWWRRPFRIHRNIGPSTTTVVCPSTFGKPCPICEYRSKLLKEGADKELTDPLKLSYRYLYAVLPVGHKKFEENVHLWDVSYSLFQKLLDQELDENEDYFMFPSLEEGYTLAVRFTEESLGKNKFYEASRIDFEERDPYDESIIKDVPDLDKVLNVMSYKELEALFLDYEEPEEEEEEKPVRRSRSNSDAPVRKRKPVVPEEEEEDEIEEEKDEPMKKPSVESRRKARTPKVEEPEEEEEEAPVKKRSSAKGDCPFGHKFGVDTDTKKECDQCTVWDACIEKKES